MKQSQLYAKIAINLIIALLTILFIIFVLPKIIGFFMPFFIAWIISMIANPLVKFMENRIKIVRKHSSMIIIIGALALVIILLFWGINSLATEIVLLINDLPELTVQFEQQFKAASENLNGIYNLLPSDVQIFLNNMTLNVNGILENILKNISVPSISNAGIVVKNVAELLFYFIITIISAYFFIAERETIIKFVKKYSPQVVNRGVNLITDNFIKAIGGYLKAQFKIMLVITVILFIGFEFLKVDYSFLIAFAIAFLDFLPVFGTGFVIWPWAVFQVVVGNYLYAVILMILYLICQIVKQVLQPKMVGDSIGLSPLATLFVMFIGYRLKGLSGLIISLPIGMVIISFYRAGMFNGIIKCFKIIIKDINEFRKM